jgi:hypothetical protein
MDAFATLVTSGRIADIVIAVMVIEAVVLITIMRKPAVATLATLLPGAFMMLALRAALSGAGWEMIVLWISASLPAHLADLWLRTKQRAGR